MTKLQIINKLQCSKISNSKIIVCCFGISVIDIYLLFGACHLVFNLIFISKF